MFILPRDVARLYDLASSPLFRVLSGFTKDIHYRLSPPLETNALLAEISGVSPDDRMLDAGCGVGGTMFWLLKHTACEVTGLTVSENERALVDRGLRRRSALARARVVLGDMTKLPSNIGAFSLIWAIESLCHIAEKQSFYREAYRSLLPSGRLVILDFFLTERFEKQKDNTLYEQLCLGLAIPELTKLDDTEHALQEEGFCEIGVRDLTRHISSSVREREVSGWIGLVVFYPFRLLGLVPDMLWNNFSAGVAQGKLFRSGKLSYVCIFAKK